ncbi:hypothetical protein [Streptococcus suis]|uniref:hypothetical protein n=1 Tax=Streptococcus suis TaxID=1307 RepID=UPI0005CE868F|nr:hypothetical protein [Streptococcus suis]MDW8778788.1 hypothetical protein [Streptococcus suis]CYV31449.1 Uncharacterised protein [Streptococcus suis]
MANKTVNKVFLIFVEGTTDADCLDLIVDYFKESFEQTDIDVRVHGGDIFTNDENFKKSGPTILKEQIENYINHYKLNPTDIIHVAFITDTDGIYVNPVEYIVNPTVVEFEYDLENKTIVCRNETKKKDVLRSRQTKSTKLSKIIKPLDESILTFNRTQISYSIYYNSLNLEHVLFEKILPDNQKRRSLDELLESIDEDPEQLMDIFNAKAITNDYLDSWQKIKNLEMSRGLSNLNILFSYLSSLQNM